MIVRMSAQVLIEELNSLIYVVRQLSSAYRNAEWAFASYLSEEVKIKIASLKASLDLSADEKTLLAKAGNDFQAISHQLHNLQRGKELKTFEVKFLKCTTNLIEVLCGIKSRATGDLTGQKDVR